MQSIIVFVPSLTESTMFTPDRSQSFFDSRLGSITDDERRKYEEERTKLYQQLDDKDDEIQAQSQLAERYRQDLQDKVRLK